MTTTDNKGAPAQEAAPNGVPAAPSPPAFDISKIPDDVLLRDPRFTGLVGRHAKRLADQEDGRRKADAIKAQEAAMIEEARSNPYQFAEKWLGEKSKEVANREFSELADKTQRDILNKLAEAYGAIPEWKELTDQEFGDVASRTAGLSGAELIAAFNAAAFDKVADKRANKRMSTEMTRRLAAEKEAWEREAAAARLKGEVAPDLARPSGNGRFDPAQLSDEEFNRWYEQNVLR